MFVFLHKDCIRVCNVLWVNKQRLNKMQVTNFFFLTKVIVKPLKKILIRIFLFLAICQFRKCPTSILISVSYKTLGVLLLKIFFVDKSLRFLTNIDTMST